MNTHELRQGNLILYSEKSLVCVVKGIDSDDFGLTISFIDSDRKYWFKSDKFKPIPLTEEWLLKFGFKNYGKFAWENKIVLQYSHGFYWFKPSNHLNYIKLLYIHQLQNLYFALTGEELEIKEAKS